MNSTNCPCESGKPYQTCCQPFHLGTPAPSAETLMRSRYTAYVLNLAHYLLYTWHPETRPAVMDFSVDEPLRWMRLQVKSTEMLDENTATVAFVAHYKVGGKAYKMKEHSLFKRIGNAWFYVDALTLD